MESRQDLCTGGNGHDSQTLISDLANHGVGAKVERHQPMLAQGIRRAKPARLRTGPSGCHPDPYLTHTPVGIELLPKTRTAWRVAYSIFFEDVMSTKVRTLDGRVVDREGLQMVFLSASSHITTSSSSKTLEDRTFVSASGGTAAPIGWRCLPLIAFCQLYPAMALPEAWGFLHELACFNPAKSVMQSWPTRKKQTSQPSRRPDM